jgi:hypothetical protein
MGAQEEGNGLTLEGLALRLETLERENERMRSENDALQSKVATLEGSQMPPGDDEEPARALVGRVSRRRLLSKAGAAAVAAVAAGTLLNPREAKANHFGDGILVDFVGAHNTDVDGIGVKGEAPNGFGVMGLGQGGVLGQGSSDFGVRGIGVSGVIGVHGISQSGHAILGEASSSAEVAGVRGLGKTGVWGSTGVSGYSGVYGQHTGSGFGVVGDGNGSTRAGVLGRNSSGYGGQFDGGLAQLKLNPKGTAGKPTSGAHTKGEIYLDSAGTLFICVASSTATAAAKWRKVTTTAV